MSYIFYFAIFIICEEQVKKSAQNRFLIVLKMKVIKLENATLSQPLAFLSLL